MSFQTDDLSLLTLGISGDQPPDAAQPPLRDGLHCRWLFPPERGFPWFGFYLFRRESAPREPRCLIPELRPLRPGAAQGLALETPLGRLSSAKPLVFTEEFPASGVVEVDLRPALLRFDLPAGVEARRVDVRIGLRGAALTRTCVDFRRFPLGSGPSPRTEKAALFTTEPAPVSPPVAVASIETWQGSLPGLQTSRQLRIALPCPATKVDLLLTNQADLAIEALAAGGSNVGTAHAVGLKAETVTLTGPAITTLVLTGPLPDSGLLHQICWECPGGGASGTGKGPNIEVAVLAGAVGVAQTVVHGGAGQVVAVTLEGKGITAVQIGQGDAALVDLCLWPSQQGVTFGWGELPGFTYPLTLPVAHPDYPCPGKPADFAAAKALALSRVTYPSPVGWDQGFAELHAELVALVEGGPAGGAMAGRTHPDLPGLPLSLASQADLPKIPGVPGLHPLELILLASLQPAIAQMLGLYFVDETAAPGVPYDYLLLADPTGVLGGNAASALAWLAFGADPTQVDAVLVAGVRTEPHPPIAPPGAGKGYALPGPAVREIDGTLPEVAGQVGLWWPLPADSTQEEPDRLVFYHPRRASLGTATPGAPPPASAYQPLPDPSPILVSEPDPPNPPAPPNPRSSDWPPPSTPLYRVDGNLAEGWYSYRFFGQDLFGRYSPLGPPAEWFQWDPPPPKPGEPPPPRPWYYQTANPGDHAIHSFAVALLDKVPPPPPLGVEAWALDPLDRWVLADDAYTAWRNGDPSLVGLRVRWRWTYLQHLQAPDTSNFRLYYEPGRWNALLGRVVTVTAAAPDQSDVDLDLGDSRAANAFADSRLRVGNRDFAILGSQPGPQLRLRVKHIGVLDEIAPAEGKPCTVAIPEGHPLWIDTSLAPSWAQRLAVVPYEPPLRTVYDPAEDPNGQALTSGNDVFQAVPVTIAGPDALFGAGPDLSGVQPWLDHLWLQAGAASEAHRIVRFDASTRRVTLESAPALSGPVTAWVLGRPTREYEIFLPAPDVGLGLPFEPSLEEPAVYAQVAVSAADDKTHVPDDPKWNGTPFGELFGNESRLSPSATVFRVLQTPPEPPDLPDLGERLLATPADYKACSTTTFRFNDPHKPLRVHILRAVDDSLFQRDWAIRETRRALNPLDSPASGPPNRHLEYFPGGWDESRRNGAAGALNAIQDPADYAALPTDARSVLNLLPGNEGFAKKEDPPPPQDQPLWDRDWLLRRTRKGLAPADADLFPKSWNATQKADAATELNGLTGPADYSKLADNSLRVLAGLPGNEGAFTQITLAPLEMKDPQIQDERRPDDDAGYISASTDLRAYTDTTLPGRATNRYFYRARFVDGAQNQSGLSLAGPPVYQRKVVPPRAPVITKVIGGDRQITIQWAANRETDLAEYRIYRTLAREDARDARLMNLVATKSSTDQAWVDNTAPAAVAVYYRLAAADSAGNESALSKSISGRAFDDSPAPVPSWKAPAVDPGGNGVVLSWALESSNLRSLLLRRLSSVSDWENLTGWLPAGTDTFVDFQAVSGESTYRLMVIDREGRLSTAAQDLTV